MKRQVLRWLAWVLGAGVLLQVFFMVRIASMAAIDPQSTAFQRSELWRQGQGLAPRHWAHQWTPYAQLSPQLKRAVIASEDDGFVKHHGLDWSALQTAWSRNERARQRAEQQTQRRQASKLPAKPLTPKVVGGSTITQQLAKNVFLSSERTMLRKSQEVLLTMALELMLSKQRVLEIYLNSVEWGEGVFGAEAAARHYYGKPAAQLNAYEAARLAVMLPRPKYFQKQVDSPYLTERAEVIMTRMDRAVLP